MNDTISFGKLKPATKKTAAGKPKQPTFTPNEHVEGEIKEAVAETVKNRAIFKDAEANYKAADAYIRETVFPTGVSNLIGDNSSSSTIVEGDGCSILFTVGGRLYPVSEDKIPPGLVDRFNKIQTVGIEVNELGDKAQSFIDRLVELATEFDVVEAISVEEKILPKGKVKDLLNGLDYRAVAELDAVYKIPTSIKVRPHG